MKQRYEFGEAFAIIAGIIFSGLFILGWLSIASDGLRVVYEMLTY